MSENLWGDFLDSHCRTRPQCRRLEVFTTDANIIRLISRRVATFSMAAARQFFDDCDAADEKFSDPVCSSIKGRKALKKSCISYCMTAVSSLSLK